MTDLSRPGACNGAMPLRIAVLLMLTVAWTAPPASRRALVAAPRSPAMHATTQLPATSPALCPAAAASLAAARQVPAASPIPIGKSHAVAAVTGAGGYAHQLDVGYGPEKEAVSHKISGLHAPSKGMEGAEKLAAGMAVKATAAQKDAGRASPRLCAAGVVGHARAHLPTVCVWGGGGGGPGGARGGGCLA